MRRMQETCPNVCASSAGGESRKISRQDRAENSVRAFSIRPRDIRATDSRFRSREGACEKVLFLRKMEFLFSETF